MSTRGMETVRRLFEAVERRDPTLLLDCYHEDVVIREADSLPYGGVYRGHEGALRHAAAFLRCWDALQNAQHRKLEPVFLDAGEHVVVLWRQKAAQADSGTELDLPAVSVYRIHQDRVAEATMYHLDTATLLALS